MADDKKVQILILAKDEASNVFSKVGDVGKTALKVVGGLAVAGFGALAGGIGYAMSEAMAAEEISAQLNAVLESTGGIAGVTAEAANNLASSLSEVTRFEDDAILSGENMLLTFTNIGQEIFPDATETMLDMSTALGQDLKSSAIQLGKALNDPILGVTALRRVGVNFTDEQQEMIKTMVEAGDVMGAQKFILQELNTEFGNSAVAAGETLAGQMDILKNTASNVAEEFGTSLIPIALEFLKEFIIPIIPKIKQFASNLLPLVKTGIERFAEWIRIGKEFFTTFILPFIQEHGQKLLKILGLIVGGLVALGIIATVIGWVTGLISIVTTLISVFSAIGGVISAVAGVLSFPLLAIILAVIAVVALLYAAWVNDWGGIRTSILEIWESTLKPIFQNLIAWFQEVIPIAIQKVSDFWNNVLLPAIQNVIAWIVSNVIPILITVFQWLAENLPVAIQFLSDTWNNVLLPALTAVWEFLQNYIFPLIMAIADFIGTVFNLAITVLAGLWQNVLYPALEKVWKFIQGNILPILEKLWGYIRDNVLPILKELKEKGLDYIEKGFNMVKKAIQYVIEKVQAFTDKLKIIKLPDWLTPGSPTPFEIGLVGIRDTLAELNRVQLPEFRTNISGLNGKGSGGSNFSQVTNVYTNSPTVRVNDFSLINSWGR